MVSKAWSGAQDADFVCALIDAKRGLDEETMALIGRLSDVHQPKLLIIWGKHDLSFDLGEPERYRKDVPKAEIHVLDAGHFALDTKADEIAGFVREFMK